MAFVSKEILGAQLSGVVGSENLITAQEILEKYSKDQSFISPRKPLCVVRPRTTEEVQAIVRISNKSKIPITPYSSGTNNQGATVPSYGGIVVDLSRMNQIIDIDEVGRVATLEPGVTFTQLQGEAKKHHLRICTPVELPATASIISSYAELVPLYSWPRYGTEFLLSMKIVLPTGEILSTGGAVYPPVKKPYDPVNVVCSFLNKIWFGSQGTLGIITWGTVKLKSLHEVNKVFFVPFDKVEDTFKPIREIKWIRVGEEMFVMNDVNLALTLAEKLPEELAELKEASPPETLIIVLRGPREEVEYQEEDLKDLTSRLGLKLETDLPGVEKAGEKILKEIEYPQGHKKMSCYKGARNTLPFITPIERITEYDKAIYELTKKYKYPKGDVGKLLLPVEIARVYYQYSFHRDPDDPENTERVRELFYEASDRLMMIGAFFTWPYGIWAEQTYSRAKTYHLLIKKFKQIVDPNNIMNPGKLAL